MKKTDYVLIGLVLIIALVGIFSSKGTKSNSEVEFPVKLAGEVGLNEITYDEYKKMVNNGDAFVVVIERDDCYYCQQYMPILKEYANEKKIAVTYININTLNEEEYNDLIGTNKYLKNNEWGTPTTLFMVGNKVVDSVGGYVEKDSIDAFFKDRVKMGE